MTHQTLLVRLPKYSIHNITDEIKKGLQAELNASVFSIRILYQEGELLDNVALVKIAISEDSQIPCHIRLPIANIQLPVMPWEEDSNHVIYKSDMLSQELQMYGNTSSASPCNCPFLKLPTSLWSKIFSNFTSEDLILFGQTCDCSYRAVFSHCQKQTSIAFSYPQHHWRYPSRYEMIISGEYMATYFLPFIAMHNLQFITHFQFITSSNSNDQSLAQEALRSMPNLKEVTVEHTYSECDWQLDFSLNTNLESLELVQFVLESDDWHCILHTCLTLKKLTFTNCGIEDLHDLADSLPETLEELTIVCDGFHCRDISLQHLQNLKKLYVKVEDENGDGFRGDVDFLVDLVTELNLPKLTSLHVEIIPITRDLLPVRRFIQHSLTEVALWMPLSRDAMQQLFDQNPNLTSLTLGGHQSATNLLNSSSQLLSLKLYELRSEDFSYDSRRMLLPSQLQHLYISSRSITSNELVGLVEQTRDLRELALADNISLDEGMFPELNNIMLRRQRSLIVICHGTQCIRNLTSKSFSHLQIVEKAAQFADCQEYMSDDDYGGNWFDDDDDLDEDMVLDAVHAIVGGYYDDSDMDDDEYEDSGDELFVNMGGWLGGM